MNDYEACPAEGAIGLLALLIGSGRLAESRLDDALVSAGLSFVKWRALDVLTKSHEPISLCCLASKLSCVKSNVTQLVDKLEAEKVIERSADPNDRRSTRVSLTSAGNEAHAIGRRALESATQALFTNYGEDERRALRALLESFAEPM